MNHKQTEEAQSPEQKKVTPREGEQGVKLPWSRHLKKLGYLLAALILAAAALVATIRFMPPHQGPTTTTTHIKGEPSRPAPTKRPAAQPAPATPVPEPSPGVKSWAKETRPTPAPGTPPPPEAEASKKTTPAPVRETGSATETTTPSVKGVAFTRALIKVLDQEINQTVLGWRPNSFWFGKLHLTDNVNNRQLGVLETVRIVSVVLKEKISRYGDADAFDPHIENAVNFFMNSAFQFWFPAADDQFNQGLEELRIYLKNLEQGKSQFYPRSDNFQALIKACKELIGNCHHNLVKKRESDGSKVSTFSVDDYFYYAQGVARAISQILEAVLTDFPEELELIKGTNLLAEVVEDLKEAGRLDPWIVLNGDLDGFLANHRANMALPMGTALFKLTNLLRY